MEGELSILYDEDATRDKSEGRSSKLNMERRNGRGLTIDATVPGTGDGGFKLTRRSWPFDSICPASRPHRKFNLNRTVYVSRYGRQWPEWYMASWKLSLAMVLLRRSLAFSSSPSAATAAPRPAASAVALSAGAGTDRRRAERRED
ncbi:hypothetical protein B296_00004742 [Ensete ventricosum]|uniref:Uncharacterized protein n=1 Tax=Ensete ventricosum TaxID=4639 RepID=A0A426Z4F6_ENSVE|nr:hypothetical protein B296_00004742 [Ensete ventricosum]